MRGTRVCDPTSYARLTRFMAVAQSSSSGGVFISFITGPLHLSGWYLRGVCQSEDHPSFVQKIHRHRSSSSCVVVRSIGEGLGTAARRRRSVEAKRGGERERFGRRGLSSARVATRRGRCVERGSSRALSTATTVGGGGVSRHGTRATAAASRYGERCAAWFRVRSSGGGTTSESRRGTPSSPR